jgi:hypothetical protein
MPSGEIKTEKERRDTMTKQTSTFGKGLPEMKISAGAVSVTVWHNETKRNDGKISEYSTISIQRSYKDAEGNWKNTNSLRLNDVPKARAALNKAYEYLVFKEQGATQQ